KLIFPDKLREGSRYSDCLSRERVAVSKPNRAEGERLRCIISVQRVAKNGMTAGGEVHANLVRAAGERAGSDEGGIGFGLEKAERGLGVLRFRDALVALHGLHAALGAWDRRDGVCARPFGFFGNAANDSQVGLLHLAALKQFGVSTHRAGAADEQYGAAGFAIEPMDEAQ